MTQRQHYPYEPSGDGPSAGSVISMAAGIMTIIAFFGLEGPAMVREYLLDDPQVEAATEPPISPSPPSVQPSEAARPLVSPSSVSGTNVPAVSEEDGLGPARDSALMGAESPRIVPGVLPAHTTIVGVSADTLRSDTFTKGASLLFRIVKPVRGPGGAELIPTRAAYLELTVTDYKVPKSEEEPGRLELSPKAVRIQGEAFATRGTVLGFKWDYRYERGDAAGSIGIGSLLGGALGLAVDGRRGLIVGAGAGAVAGGVGAGTISDNWIEIPMGAELSVRLDEELDLRSRLVR